MADLLPYEMSATLLDADNFNSEKLNTNFVS